MRINILTLLLIGLFGCKEKQLSPEEIKPLVGHWRLDAVEYALSIKKWEIIPPKNAYSFEIRYDGVILDQNGLPSCCGPKFLNFNQKLFLIEPKEILPPNPQCALVLCAACDTWNLDLQGDTLIVSYCTSEGRNRFVRM